MAMAASQLCCCCTLRTGTIIIGRFILVCSFLTALSSSGKLYHLLVSTVEVDQKDFPEEFQNERGDMNQIKEDVKAFLVGGIVGGTVQAILNIMLLVGVLKNQRILVIIWLVAYTVICVLDLLVFASSFFLFESHLAFQVVLGINIGLYLYFLLVVWNFHKSAEAGYNRLWIVVDVYQTENCNIKRMPLENPT